MILLDEISTFLGRQKRDEGDALEREMWNVALKYDLETYPDYDWPRYWEEGDPIPPECWCPDWAQECHDYVEYCPRHGFYCPLDLKPHPSTMEMYKGVTA